MLVKVEWRKCTFETSVREERRNGGGARRVAETAKGP